MSSPVPAPAPLDPAAPVTVDPLLAESLAALRRPAWHLVFPPALEARFEADQGAARSRQLVWGGLFALAIFDLFLLHDGLVRPETLPQALFYRLGVMTSLSVLVLSLVWRGLPPRWREGLLGANVTLGMWTSCEIFHHTPGSAAFYDPFLFSMVFMAGNISFPLRFRAAVFSSLASLAVATLYVAGDERLPVIARSFAMGLMLGTALFTCMACYRIERSQRHAYLLLLREALHSRAAVRRADEMTAISQTDALTGLPNRRAFDEALHRAWPDGGAAPPGLALLMIDIDHFKHYNDQHGHPQGDRCLRSVAQAMAAVVREGDLLARLGGEEFALLLPLGAAHDLAATAERLRQAVRGLQLPHEGPHGPTVVSVSLGGAAPPAAGVGTAAQLMAAADAALYQAKREGRNRWVLHGHDGVPAGAR